MKNNKSILIFGVGTLQKSIIELCKKKGLFTIGIDPNENAECKNLVDLFIVVDGNDLKQTINIAKNYAVSGLITAATDKPLQMMAKVATELTLPFFSLDTAKKSTDKFLMKQVFQKAGIQCAKGFILDSIEKLKNIRLEFPIIVKPRDNSGSRGVKYCVNLNEVEVAVQEAFSFTRKKNILLEEFVEGQEYSVECLHYNCNTYLMQITEKKTTNFPYNVELEHIQPAELNEEIKKKIHYIVSDIAKVLRYKNCASHSEIKINNKGIYVIETSPRLGGDFISSTLVPLSTGVNMEEILIDMAIKNSLCEDFFKIKINKFSGIKYFEISQGVIKEINDLKKLDKIPGLKLWKFNLHVGDEVNQITSSLNRYGYAIIQCDTKKMLTKGFEDIDKIIKQEIIVNRS